MERRQALALTALAFAAGCRPKPPSLPESPRREPLEGAELIPVDVDPSLVIRSIAGLRPFRPDGFVVRREEVGEKVLIHNYGHGGGGMTLSWGCSRQAVDLAGPVSGRACAVVG